MEGEQKEGNNEKERKEPMKQRWREENEQAKQSETVTKTTK